VSIQEETAQFAREWIEAWNAHDLERILSHYTDDFEMSSPFIITLFNEPSGTLKGREQVSAYWETALERLPDLHFELLEAFAGVHSIVILFKLLPHKATQGKRCMEVFFLNESGKAYKAMAHHEQP
jgi:hypothetical protein